MILGCLISWATEDFGLVDTFVEQDDIKFEQLKLSLYHAEPILCMLDLTSTTTSPSPSTSTYLATTIKYIDRIASTNRRNTAILNQSHICRHLSKIIDDASKPTDGTGTTTLPEDVISAARGTYKRVLEMGMRFGEAEEMFKDLVQTPPNDSGDFSLLSGVLERLKIGMRTAGIWPPFVCMGDGKTSMRAGLRLENSRMRGRSFPSALGFTFAVSAHFQEYASDDDLMGFVDL